MKKYQTLKGFRDFLPKNARNRQYVIGIIRKVFESYGYDPIETPALEYAEVLQGKSGEETDKLLYTFQDMGGRKLGLRYDQTVPTARFISEYKNELAFPFKRYQIQLAWRQEKPQKGRYREFLQVDGDLIGLKGALSDAEIIALIYDIYQKLGLKNIVIKINDRQVLSTLIKSAGVSEKLNADVIRIIDKLGKIGKSGISKELNKVGLTKQKVKKVLAFLEKAKPSDNLEKVFGYLKKMQIPETAYKFEPSLARGLDYYTGTIFEVSVPEFKAGSVLGGGRYDKLIGQFTKGDIPAVGFGLGFDRTFEAMEQFNLLPKQKTSAIALVTIFSPEHLEKSIEITKLLRKGGINTELYSDENSNLAKQLKYADKKGVLWVIIIGPDEILKNSVVIKNLKTKKQETIPENSLLSRIK